MIIDLLEIRDKNKAKEWISILKANPGSAKITDKTILISSNIFMQLIGLEAQELQGKDLMLFMSMQQNYIHNYQLTQLSY